MNTMPLKQVYFASALHAAQVPKQCPMCDAEAKTRQRLVALGYEIENMELVFGPVYRGQFRWFLYQLDITVPDPMIAFQDYEPSYNEDDAWESALDHAKEAGTWAA